MTTVDFESLTLTEIIRVQNQLSEVLARRFEKPRTLAFTDIVGSTAYFARFGDKAGRALQQLHHDLLQEAIAPHDGRVVDTAGDGAFCCFPNVPGALEALVAFQLSISEQNLHRKREQQLMVRVGVHHGSVLTDGDVVTGDAVNFAARVADSAASGEIRVSIAALQEAPNEVRVRCRALPSQQLKGITGATKLFRYVWREQLSLPTHVLIVDTGEQIELPDQDIISFGRLDVHEDGSPANDIVLTHPDETTWRSISRWHFELRRTKEGFLVKPVSNQIVEINGEIVQKGDQHPVQSEAIIRLSHKLDLVLKAPLTGSPDRSSLATLPLDPDLKKAALKGPR